MLRLARALASLIALLPGFGWAQGLDQGVWPSLGASAAPPSYMAAPVQVAMPSSGTIPNNATRYFGLAASAPGVANSSTTEAQAATPVAGNVSITGLNVVSTVAIATGTWTATLRKNAATPSPTLTCAITGGASSCTDNFGTTADHLEVNAGDTLDLMLVPTGSPTVSNFGFTFLMRSNDGQSLPLFAGSAVSLTLASASPQFWQGQVGSVLIPQAGHIQNLYVQLSAAVGAGNTDTITVWYGACGAETSGTGSLIATITGAGISTGQDLNAGHGLDVAVGNCLLMVASGSASAPAEWVNASVQWSPGTTGANFYYPYFAVGTTLITSVSGRWCGPSNAANCYTGNWAPLMPDLATTIDSRVATARTITAMTSTTSGAARNWTLVPGNTTTGNPTCQQGAASAVCAASSGSATLSPGTSYGIYNILTGTGTGQTVWRAGYAVTVQ